MLLGLALLPTDTGTWNVGIGMLDLNDEDRE